MANRPYEEKTIVDVLQEIKHEFSAFLTTRIQIAAAEIREKISSLKVAVPMLGAAALLGLVGFLTLTFTLIAVLAEFLDTQYAWAIAAGIVTVIYLAVAGLVGWLGYREISLQNLTPERTLRVLKADQSWIKKEAEQNWTKDEARAA